VSGEVTRGMCRLLIAVVLAPGVCGCRQRNALRTESPKGGGATAQETSWATAARRAPAAAKAAVPESLGALGRNLDRSGVKTAFEFLHRRNYRVG
jgi:hypothetical protein